MTKKNALITFVKAPVPGTVKTRLQADIGAERTVKIYKSFVTGLTSQCARIKGVDKFLGCAPSDDHPFLRKIAFTNRLETFNQMGKTLGERIFNAFRHCAQKGYSEIVLIGSDSPSMPPAFIKQAFYELRKNDFVIGPCFDQGLYLIGVTAGNINRLASILQLDTGKDVSVILKKLSRKNITFTMLPFWYDVDNIDDYQFLKLHLSYMNNTLHNK
jgi:rSAM/selenodomain-associated transferase 1